MNQQLQQIASAIRGPVDRCSIRKTNLLGIGVSAGVSGSGNLHV